MGFVNLSYNFLPARPRWRPKTVTSSIYPGGFNSGITEFDIGFGNYVFFGRVSQLLMRWTNSSNSPRHSFWPPYWMGGKKLKERLPSPIHFFVKVPDVRGWVICVTSQERLRRRLGVMSRRHENWRFTRGDMTRGLVAENSPRVCRP